MVPGSVFDVDDLQVGVYITIQLNGCIDISGENDFGGGENTCKCL